MKEFSDRMHAQREARRNNAAPPAPDAIGRLRRGAEAMSARGAALTKLADAAEPLYKSLDDGQKRRFGMLMRMGGRPGAHHWQRRADLAR